MRVPSDEIAGLDGADEAPSRAKPISWSRAAAPICGPVYVRALISLGSCAWLLRGMGGCVYSSVCRLKRLLLNVFDSQKRTLPSLPSDSVGTYGDSLLLRRPPRSYTRLQKRHWCMQAAPR